MTLIYPMLAQVAWTLAIVVMTGRARVRALKERRVRLGDIALSNANWPDREKAFGNNLANQFETPVLFYVLCGIAIHIGATGWVMIALAWLYVGTRVVHTLIHTGGNNVLRRFQVFVLGVLTLAAMLVAVIIKLAAG